MPGPLPEADAARHDQARIIDESDEGYLFPAEHFAEIELPQAVRGAVLAAVHSAVVIMKAARVR